MKFTRKIEANATLCSDWQKCCFSSKETTTKLVFSRKITRKHSKTEHFLQNEEKSANSAKNEKQRMKAKQSCLNGHHKMIFCNCSPLNEHIFKVEANNTRKTKQLLKEKENFSYKYKRIIFCFVF